MTKRLEPPDARALLNRTLRWIDKALRGTPHPLLSTKELAELSARLTQVVKLQESEEAELYQKLKAMPEDELKAWARRLLGGDGP